MCQRWKETVNIKEIENGEKRKEKATPSTAIMPLFLTIKSTRVRGPRGNHRFAQALTLFSCY